MADKISQADKAFASMLADYIADADDKTPEVAAAFAALAISLFALVAAALGVIQQYFASASGYNNCDRKVMGQWSNSRLRILKLKDFRFEVQYEAPVIFLCRPDYDRTGPVEGVPVIKLDGSEDGRKESWTEEESDSQGDTSAKKGSQSRRAKRAEAEAKKQKENDAIHTADNDLATWVTLLKTIQNMETRSQEWQKTWFTKYPPKAGASLLSEEKQQAVHDKQTIVVAIQKKKRSYDTMPAGIKKPFATTTWCHMIELLALLGIYWVKFDRTSDRYRAEGNGFVVSGEKVSDLGVIFSFQVARGSRFEENRIIPSEHIKDLAFGMVSTVYSRPSAKDARRLNNSDRQDISHLHFASRAEIAESLVLIGCNTNAVNYFARDDHNNKRTAHLFPLVFEIIGMLSKTFHIENSGFRYLPNPTIYTWNNKNFSLRGILQGYLTQMRLYHMRSGIQKSLQRHGNCILQKIDDDRSAWPSILLLNALHEALRDTDIILTGAPPTERPSMPSREATQYSADLSRRTQAPTSEEKLEDMPESEEQQARRTQVQDVLRGHIQEVLSELNKPLRPRPTSESSMSSNSEGSSTPSDREPRFEDIDSATPEEKQEKLMEVYFKVIRSKVIKRTHETVKRRRESIAVVFQGEGPPMGGMKRSSTMKTATSQTLEVDEDDDENNMDAEVGDDEDSLAEDSVPELAQGASTEDIWCTLVFRMICWLMLHDFNKMDVQIPKTELHGSRLRVYIA